jgi:E2/UBC family protein E
LIDVPVTPDDQAFLDARGLKPEVVEEGGMTCLAFFEWPLPHGFTTGHADLLVRLPAGYPDIAPDMWWFAPAVSRSDRGEIPQTQVTEQHIGRTWQRWSRHFSAGQWKSGIDSLETFLALINREVAASSGQATR